MGKLQQATRNFGAHVVSGLCPLIQNLYWECHQWRIWHVTIDLLAPEPLPECLRQCPALRQAMPGLREKFFSILDKHSTSLAQVVVELKIDVDFAEVLPPQAQRLKDAGNYHFHAPPYACRIVTADAAGRRFEVAFSDMA